MSKKRMIPVILPVLNLFLILLLFICVKKNVETHVEDAADVKAAWREAEAAGMAVPVENVCYADQYLQYGGGSGACLCGQHVSDRGVYRDDPTGSVFVAERTVRVSVRAVIVHGRYESAADRILLWKTGQPDSDPDDSHDDNRCECFFDLSVDKTRSLQITDAIKDTVFIMHTDSIFTIGVNSA